MVVGGGAGMDAESSRQCILCPLSHRQGCPQEESLSRSAQEHSRSLTPVLETQEKTQELPKAELALNSVLLSLPFFSV